ncbi:1,2-phenylacetyl-CoA epoxidase subunit PaaC [Shouchella patagoniensis]|uniref:1,2-phenylacetyl-CoA epoxidase subunit PaaC n=1 Tax=Shouchella patagoniensis TaxID=228576 RepID=UPI000995927C|nr:1,2-phenylacetyl-CoA epoxidase subunit PaaC [Shouchella patagoniensis]
MNEHFVYAHREELISLLLQLADDDFIYAFRGAEWLGLAPHIEEDVASASISQNSMGHASMFYELAEELGLDEANILAHARPAKERRNSILLERVNGEGSYMGTPTYNWAYTVVRNYFYTQAKKIKMESLRSSSYTPLIDVALKVNMELHYHLLHWRTWFVQLVGATEEANEKMVSAIKEVMVDFGDLFSYGKESETIIAAGLIESSDVLLERWKQQMESIFHVGGLDLHLLTFKTEKNGRNQEHTADLDQAIATLAEVYQVDPAAIW